jgi:hypothetical protein
MDLDGEDFFPFNFLLLFKVGLAFRGRKIMPDPVNNYRFCFGHKNKTMFL